MIVVVILVTMEAMIIIVPPFMEPEDSLACS